jgi:DNA segregation ATPase FtsK/SpoIIIE-like protein
MSGNGDLRKMLQENRLQHQLEIQSKQIETVLSENELDAQVAGGYVQSRSIRFDLSSHLEAGLGKLRFLKHDILNALGVADVEIEQSNGRWHLNVKRPDEPPVSLLDLLTLIPDLEPLTAVVGMSEEGSPIFIELSAEAVPHILIAGDDNAGKSSLLRTIALSLAVSNKQHQLQIAVMDGNKKNIFGKDRILTPLSFLPHMVCAVADEAEDQQD